MHKYSDILICVWKSMHVDIYMVPQIDATH